MDDGTPIVLPEYKYAKHDCDYTKKRSALVLMAEANTTAIHGAVTSDIGPAWNSTFAAEMEKLAAGIV